MPVTIQNVLDLARETLNDDPPVRWPDTECLKYAQDALDAVYSLRPDLFHGQFTTFDSSTLTLLSNFPLSGRLRRRVADYIIMRCETKDDEQVVNQRVTVAYQFFKEQLA
jgi:hypothetical protein